MRPSHNRDYRHIDTIIIIRFGSSSSSVKPKCQSPSPSVRISSGVRHNTLRSSSPRSQDYYSVLLLLLLLSLLLFFILSKQQITRTAGTKKQKHLKHIYTAAKMMPHYKKEMIGYNRLAGYECVPIIRVGTLLIVGGLSDNTWREVMLLSWGDWKRETWHRETCFSVRVNAHYKYMFDSGSIIWAAHRFYVCSSISFCFTYCYARQTKLASSLDNVWAHCKIVIDW